MAILQKCKFPKENLSLKEEQGKFKGFKSLEKSKEYKCIIAVDSESGLVRHINLQNGVLTCLGNVKDKDEMIIHVKELAPYGLKGQRWLLILSIPKDNSILVKSAEWFNGNLIIKDRMKLNDTTIDGGSSIVELIAGRILVGARNTNNIHELSIDYGTGHLEVATIRPVPSPTAFMCMSHVGGKSENEMIAVGLNDNSIRIAKLEQSNTSWLCGIKVGFCPSFCLFLPSPSAVIVSGERSVQQMIGLPLNIKNGDFKLFEPVPIRFEAEPIPNMKCWTLMDDPFSDAVGNLNSIAIFEEDSKTVRLLHLCSQPLNPN